MANNTDRFFRLVEYSIRNGRNILTEADAPVVPDVEEKPLGYEKKGKLGSAPKPGVPATEPSDDMDEDSLTEPQVPTDEIAPDPSNPEETTPDKAEDKPTEDVEDVLGKLVRLHAGKLSAIDDYMNQNQMLIQQVAAKTNEIDGVKAELMHMKGQIKILTPPTPLEAGDRMISVAGGVRIEDYWNDWLAKNKRDTKIDGNPYYPNETGEGLYSVDSGDIPDLSKDQIKKSFFGNSDY